YPDSLEDEIAIMEQESRAWESDVPVRVPVYLEEILAAFTAELRRSPHVNHRSGVSVRYSIGNLETLSAAAIRRAARAGRPAGRPRGCGLPRRPGARRGEPEAVPRVCDLPAVVEAGLGRVEFDTIEEGREEEILSRALKTAELQVFRRRLSGFDFQPILSRFAQGFEAETSDLLAASELLGQFGELPGLSQLLQRLGVEEEAPRGGG